MKKIMKKALSLMLVMAMLIVPMTAMAAEDGSAENPYRLSPESTQFYVDVQPEETMWIQASAENGTVEVSESTTNDWFIQYGRLLQVYPEADGTAALTLEGYDTFSVYNSSETETVRVYMSFTAGEAVDTTGTKEDPEVVTLTEDPASGALGASLTKELVAGNEGYFYKCTAPADGVVVVGIHASDAESGDMGWMYFVNNETAAKYGDSHNSDEEVPVTEERCEVKAGDEVVVFASTYDPANEWVNPAGTVHLTVSFEAKEAGDGSTDDGNTGDGSTDDENTGDDNTGDASSYVVSDAALVVGDNALSVDASSDYTVYILEPAETGVYTITSADSVFGFVGGFWVTESLVNADIVKETTLEWECTAVGQAIYIAVKADGDTANINIAREELVVKEEVPWTYYENKVTPQPFHYDGDFEELSYIDFEEEDLEALQAVLGTDGYYHLYNENGPVLFAKLNDSMMSLADATNYGQLKHYAFDEEGNVIARTDYNAALLEYFACADEDTGLYPLTSDLIEIYQKVGAYMGWYGEDGYLGIPEEDGWMFACYYGTKTTLAPEGEELPPAGGAATDGDSTDTPKTGDDTNIGIWIAVLGLGGVAIAGSFLLKKKK